MRKETDTKRLMCPYSKTKTQNFKLIIVHLPQTRHQTPHTGAGCGHVAGVSVALVTMQVTRLVGVGGRYNLGLLLVSLADSAC